MKMNHTCKGCGATVSDNFARVYGDNDNVVHRCMDCVDSQDGGRSILRHGGAAYEDQDEVEYRMKSPRFDDI